MFFSQNNVASRLLNLNIKTQFNVDIFKIVREFNTKNIVVYPKLSTGVAKLKKDGIASFSLPAGITCPCSGDCNEKRFCYAQFGHYLYDNNVKSRINNLLAAIKLGDFVAQMVTTIRKQNKYKTIRLHDSGDFFDQQYVNDWTEIARACPEYRFYAYTKSLHLDFKAMLQLTNFALIQSEGGTMDALINYSLPHSKIFPSIIELTECGYIDGTHSDLVALSGATRLGLIAHGAGKNRAKCAFYNS